MKNIIQFKIGAVYSRRSTLNHNGTEYTMATHHYRVAKKTKGYLGLIPCDSNGNSESPFGQDWNGYKCTIELRSGRVEVVNTMGSHNDRVSGGYPEMVLSSATSLCHQLT